MGQPIPVRAKGVREAFLLTRRDQLWRYDVLPFLVLYVLIALKAVYHVSRFEWWDRSAGNMLEQNQHTENFMFVWQEWTDNFQLCNGWGWSFAHPYFFVHAMEHKVYGICGL